MRGLFINKQNVGIVLGLFLCSVSILGGALYVFHTKHVRVTIPDIDAVAHSPSGYVTLDGSQFTLSSHAARYTIVTSWASWCPTCASNLSVLSTLKQQKENSDIAIFAINRKEQKDLARVYMKDAHLPESIVYVFDTDDHFFSTIGGYAMPETVVYDRTGKAVAHVRDALTIQSAHDLFESFARE